MKQYNLSKLTPQSLKSKRQNDSLIAVLQSILQYFSTKKSLLQVYVFTAILIQ